MPRIPRKRSETGIYHIMRRGINKQIIFKDNEDREKFLKTIAYYKGISKYELYSYCLMNNHIHLLMKETTEPVSSAIKRICGSYVHWYNGKYQRCGHLFQERFKSEPVETEAYFLTVLRYIHQNPVKAGASKKVSDYKWSSYHEYIEKPFMIDINYALEIFSFDKKIAIKLFEQHTNEKNDDNCLEYQDKIRVTDREVQEYLLQLGIKEIKDLQTLEKVKRNEIIKEIRSIDGITIRQISKITGISKSAIGKI